MRSRCSCCRKAQPEDRPVPQHGLVAETPNGSPFFKQELMNIYRWKDENLHKQELGRPEEEKADKSSWSRVL